MKSNHCAPDITPTLAAPTANQLCCVSKQHWGCCSQNYGYSFYGHHCCFTSFTKVHILHPLLWITVVSTCCGYMLHPIAVNILLPLLWSTQNHYCGILSTAVDIMPHLLAVHGYTAAMAVDTMLHSLAVDILLPLLWISAVNIACHW